MVMTLRREEKCFDVAFQPFEQIVEASFHRSIFQSSLLVQNASRVLQIVILGEALQDEIKAMGRESPRHEEFRDRVETGRQRIWRNMFENRDGKNRVE